MPFNISVGIEQSCAKLESVLSGRRRTWTYQLHSSDSSPSGKCNINAYRQWKLSCCKRCKTLCKCSPAKDARRTDGATDRQPDEIRARGIPGSKSILKMLTTKSICLMDLHVVHPKPKRGPTHVRTTYTTLTHEHDCGCCFGAYWVCASNPPDYKSVQGKVGAVATGNSNLIPIRRTQPWPEQLHLINSRLKCICSWAQGRTRPKQAKSGSSNLWPYIWPEFLLYAPQLSTWPTRAPF